MSPVVFAPLPIDTFNIIKLTVLWTLTILALGFWLGSCLAGRPKPPVSLLLYPAAGFVFFLLVSTIFSASPRFSLLGHYTRYGGLIPYLSYGLIAFAFYALFWERPHRLQALAYWGWLAAIVVSGYVLIQEAGLDWKAWQNPGGDVPVSPTSTLGNSNFAGGYLAITLPLGIYCVVSMRPWRNRFALGGLLGLHGLALWYTQARGGMVAAMAGTSFLLFCYRERIPHWVKATSLAVLISLSALAVVAIWHPGANRRPEAISNVRQLDSFSLQTRFWYWSASAKIFRDHPFIGTGPDTFLFFYPQYRLPRDGKIMGLNVTDKPHNVLMEHLSNEGALGAGAYGLTVGLGLWYGYRRSRQLEGMQRLLLVTLTGVLIAYLAQGFFSIDVPPLAVMGWVSLGAIAAVADPAAVAARGKIASMAPERAEVDTKDRKGSAFRKARSRVLYAGLLALILGLAAIATRPLMADVKAGAGRAQDAIELNPLEGEYYIRAGDTFRSIAGSTRDPLLAADFYDRAEREYRRALRIQPRNVIYMIRVANLYSIRSQRIDPTQAIEARRRWKRVLDFNPTDRDVRLHYGSAKRAARRTVEEAQRAVQEHPGEPRAWVNLGRVYLALGNRDEAEKSFQRAVSIDPTHEVARRLLEQSLHR